MVVAESADAARDAAELIESRTQPLPAVTDPARGAGAGRAALVGGVARQSLRRRRERRPRGGGRGLRAGASRGAARLAQPARLRDADGAARRDRRIRRGGGPLHAPFARARACIATRTASSARWRDADRGARRHRRCRRRVRRALAVLSRISAAAVGGAAARPAGQMDRDARPRSFLSDFQARELAVEGALALDRDGRFLALTLDYVGNLGAYPVSFAVPANLLRMAGGVYDIPAIHVRVRGVATNTLPVGVYRGAGRPESTFMMERLIDLAAAELGIDRADAAPPQPHRRGAALPVAARPSLRQRRLRRRIMATALRLVDWDGFRRAARGAKARQGRARHRRRQLSRIADRLRRRAHRSDGAARGPRRRRDRHRRERPGARDELRPGGGEPLRDPARRGRDPLRRQRRGGDRAAARIPTARCGSAARSWCARARRIIARGAAARGARARSRGRGHRLCATAASPSPARTVGRPLRGRASRSIRDARGAARPLAAPPRCRSGSTPSDRRRRLRGRDRSRDRRGAARALCHGRRCRPRHQSDDRRGPGAWRHRARRRPGADGGVRL